MHRQTAAKILKELDNTAGVLERLASKGLIPKESTQQILQKIDAFADKLEIQAFGRQAFESRQAKVIQRDPDEKYMDTFDNVNKPLDVEADEPYMHTTGPTFHGKGAPTFDADRSSVVSERPEFNVRDLSEWAEPTKPQPSWKGPRGGKSLAWG